MKRYVRLLTVLLVILMCLGQTACAKTKVEMAPYLSVSYTGYNGNGSARVDFDFAGFEYGIMSKWKEKEKLEKLVELTAVETTITYAADVSQGLSNGDTITVKIDLDKKLAKKYGYAFTKLEKKFTVEGLTEAIVIDPFDEGCLALSVEGVSPFAYLDIRQTASAGDPRAHISYAADRQFDLKNGDAVTVTASLSERYAQQGYVLARNEMTLAVEGLQSYITDVASLSSADVSAIRDKAVEYYNVKLAEGWLNLYVGGGQNYMSKDDIGSIGEPRFTDTGYAVARNGWGVTAALIVPFKVDIGDVAFHWWNNDYYEQPLLKTFSGMSGYFVITDLLLDANGQLIREGNFGIEMSDFFETEQQMLDSLANKFGLEGVREGAFAA